MSKENENENRQAREQDSVEPGVDVNRGGDRDTEIAETDTPDAGANGNPADNDSREAARVVEGELITEEADETPDIEQLKKELEEKKSAAEDYYNRLLRLQADFDNYRRRTARERDEIARYAAASLCEALLPVLDNFQLALSAKDQDPAKVAEGVEMIYRQLMDVLQKEGLTPIEAEGQQFDPTRHEAVMRENTDQYPDNTVIAELRRGYYLKDKLLRPSMVKVARAE